MHSDASIYMESASLATSCECSVFLHILAWGSNLSIQTKFSDCGVSRLVRAIWLHGQVVSGHAFSYDDPSSNPAEVNLQFFFSKCSLRSIFAACDSHFVMDEEICFKYRPMTAPFVLFSSFSNPEPQFAMHRRNHWAMLCVFDFAVKWSWIQGKKPVELFTCF